jgi:hypothetical protein
MQTCGHTDTRTCRHADMRTYRHADMQTCGHADMQTCIRRSGADQVEGRSPAHVQVLQPVLSGQIMRPHLRAHACKDETCMEIEGVIKSKAGEGEGGRQGASGSARACTHLTHSRTLQNCGIMQRQGREARKMHQDIT